MPRARGAPCARGARMLLGCTCRIMPGSSKWDHDHLREEAITSLCHVTMPQPCLGFQERRRCHAKKKMASQEEAKKKPCPTPAPGSRAPCAPWIPPAHRPSRPHRPAEYHPPTPSPRFTRRNTMLHAAPSSRVPLHGHPKPANSLAAPPYFLLPSLPSLPASHVVLTNRSVPPRFLSPSPHNLLPSWCPPPPAHGPYRSEGL